MTITRPAPDCGRDLERRRSRPGVEVRTRCPANAVVEARPGPHQSANAKLRRSGMVGFTLGEPASGEDVGAPRLQRRHAQRGKREDDGERSGETKRTDATPRPGRAVDDAIGRTSTQCCGANPTRPALQRAGGGLHRRQLAVKPRQGTAPPSAVRTPRRSFLRQEGAAWPRTILKLPPGSQAALAQLDFDHQHAAHGMPLDGLPPPNTCARASLAGDVHRVANVQKTVFFKQHAYCAALSIISGGALSVRWSTRQYRSRRRVSRASGFR